MADLKMDRTEEGFALSVGEVRIGYVIKKRVRAKTPAWWEPVLYLGGREMRPGGRYGTPGDAAAEVLRLWKLNQDAIFRTEVATEHFKNVEQLRHYREGLKILLAQAEDDLLSAFFFRDYARRKISHLLRPELAPSPVGS